MSKGFEQVSKRWEAVPETAPQKVAGKVAGFIALQGGFSDCSPLQENVQTLENKGFMQERKKPCNDLQGVKIPQVGFEENVEKALFSRGESDSGKWRFPQRFPSSDKIELILDLIDSLDWEDKERLFERLESVSR